MRFFFILIISFFYNFIFAQNVDSTAKPRTINKAVGDFHFLYQSIRSGEISERVAQDSTFRLLNDIKKYYVENGGTEDSPADWVFPVEGYGINMIGGKNGSDYIPGNYNFYNTSHVHVHPAHDIFINDNDQDKLDDRTHLPVNVRSFTHGVVVSVEYFWDVNSEARGGNYIYIYEPFSRKIYYYAHNELVMVQLGDVVKAGQVISTIGRSGFNAYKKRSPTHLHFSILQFDEAANGTPLKPFSFLKMAKR